MDNKRLSLSNLHDQIDSLRSSEWPTMKRYFRRQIVKCINECKTQACNAKKLVETIKDHTKPKGSERTEDDDDDDDVGWGSDFDTDDSDDNEDSNQQNLNIKGKNTLEYNLHQSCEDMASQPFSYLSNGSFRSLDESQLQFQTNNENICEDRQQINESKVNHRLTDRTNSENSVLIETKLNSNQIQNSSTFSLNEKPKPATKPRSLPKPPSTKPEIPKNKPQIIPRKPFIDYSAKPVISPQIKRPPSEPPPPPLPKSPPPLSPSVKPTDLEAIITEAINYLQELDNETKVIEKKNEETTYEVLPDNQPEDEYLTPNEIPVDRKRKNSSSTISSQSTGYSLRDGESPNGYSLSLSSQTLNQLPTNGNSLEDREESVPINDNMEQDYEEVNVNQNDLLFSSQRPPLPKIKESPISTKTKRIPDLFPNLQNWNKNPKEKKNIKDKNDNENCFEDNLLPSLPSDPINMNNSLGITARPLPPLPPLPSLPLLSPISQSLTFTSTESLRSYEWFHEVEREDAEALLMTQDEDGAYLVRESKRAGKSNPYTLTIYHNGRVFHLNIRKRPDGLYALGKEKSREKTFKTVADLVLYHTTEPILLTTRGTPAGKTRLMTTPSS